MIQDRSNFSSNGKENLPTIGRNPKTTNHSLARKLCFSNLRWRPLTRCAPGARVGKDGNFGCELNCGRADWQEGEGQNSHAVFTQKAQVICLSCMYRSVVWPGISVLQKPGSSSPGPYKSAATIGQWDMEMFYVQALCKYSLLLLPT